MSIATEKISFSQGLTSYKVKVDSFKHKMNTWKNGKHIFLKEFIVDGTNLRLEVFPNGLKDSAKAKKFIGHVSLYIKNCSEVNIDIHFDVNMGKKVKFTDKIFSIKAGVCMGFGHFYNHDDENRWDDEAEQYGSHDADFEITLTVKKLWKQFDVNGVNNNVAQNLRSVEKELESLGDSVKRLLSKKEEDSKNNIPYPECPICLEDMTVKTRIMQCFSGHPMCSVCHDKLETKICPTCKMEMIGRNYGMESYLRTLFSDQNGN